ncbi:GNAT family N-acetyltransferase [Paremcibacter congregatus]|uniref:N-acetyltransferase domain-containing protein n=1 Tax=Paremcibacter congregatus TaxID=2043170 RepID=A0A2G4YTQ5_9PROT|nr:GNAT family N-acetyltransferase [Paremcibacter congregatus]PHZ85701.1 hypothetical protein CRD36_03165 [Paremcibacter congregatus]QDE26662.1 GNAT family N-acetyltransferase [Paremcibacter congregatus]
MTDITIEKITTAADLEKCFQIRTIVFVEEQHVAQDEEIDGLDPQADQYLLSVDGAPTATARVRYVDGLAKIERVAVLKTRRGLNIGRKLMEFIIADIKAQAQVSTLKLGAQIQVVGFYQQLGFQEYGDEFLDAGIRHKWMKRTI